MSLGGLLLLAAGGGAALAALSALSGGGGGGTGSASAFISNGRSMIGWEYFLGAGLPDHPTKTSPPYTDCGKFISDALNLTGISGVPRTITAQVEAAPMKRNVLGLSRAQVISQLRPGECVAFKWSSGGFPGRPYDHGGIYTGDGKLLHASSSKGGVVEVNFPQSGWKTIYTWY